MKLDQKQIRLLVNLQESLEQKEVKFLVFHEDQKYTITNQLEDAMIVNSTIFVITSNNIVSLDPVVSETQEEIKEQVDIILSLIENESITEKIMNRKEDSLIPFKENPTYLADLFAVIAYELEYSPEEIQTMLSILERMQSIYAEYFRNKQKSKLEELTFVAEKILLQINKSEAAIDLFTNVLADKIHLPHFSIEQQANSILSSLLLEQIK